MRRTRPPELSSTLPPSPARPPATQEGRRVSGNVRGTRAGLIVFLGIAAVNLGNSAFHLVAARYLGPADYAEVASLLAVAGIIGLPLGALQVLVARYVAADAALGRSDAIASVTRRSIGLAGAISLFVTVVLVALSPVVQRLLSIDDPLPVILTAVITPAALILPVLLGLAQGLQRFGTFAVSIGIGAIARLVVLVGLLAVGLSVNGALAATLIGSIVSLIIPTIVLSRWLRPPSHEATVASIRELLRSLLPIAIGTLAITSLTTADLIVAKITLSDTDAGLYGSASLIGRLILYVPATIATVLLPKVSGRAAANQETSDILGASLVVTAGIAAVALAFFLVAPGTIIDASFGSRFDNATSLLALFGISMTGYALLNILLIYHLGHGSTGMSWLLLVGAAVQLFGYSLLHESGRELIAVGMVTAIALLVAHELLIERSYGFAVAWVRSVVARR